jgi:predicted HTH transcriptional regulator
MVETFSQRIKEDIVRFLSEPTREGLQELIRFFGGEFDQYELKEAWPPLPRMAKTALAIANSGGGVIIFGIRDATLEPVGLIALASKQAVFDTFRSYIPAPLINEITLLDFDYTNTDYAPLRGKQIQVLAIPDIPEAIPFVCEEEWHKEDEHVRRGAIYVRSGTNTREANYDQVQRLLNRRIETISPQTSTNRVRRELDQLQMLYVARTRASVPTSPNGDLQPVRDDVGAEFRSYLEHLINRKHVLVEQALGLIPDADYGGVQDG